MAGLILISSYFEVLDFTLFVTQFDVLKKPKYNPAVRSKILSKLDIYSLRTEEVHTQATVQHQVSLLLSCGLGPVGASTLLLFFLLLLLLLLSLFLLLLLLLFKSSHGWSCISAQKNPSAIEFFMRVTNCQQFYEYSVFLGLRHRSLVGLCERMLLNRFSSEISSSSREQLRD